jgi:hypothetical protein
MNAPSVTGTTSQVRRARLLALLVSLVILAACQFGDVQFVREAVEQPLGAATTRPFREIEPLRGAGMPRLRRR